ncbi:MAG: hypothetical protein ACRC3Y_13795 [Romboutsia sp.]|uniref:hypothetical protein n=1 Tax=Romboutsia sp. TaxID=1965302 RepID=UPI003F310C1F
MYSKVNMYTHQSGSCCCIRPTKPQSSDCYYGWSNLSSEKNCSQNIEQPKHCCQNSQNKSVPVGDTFCYKYKKYPR